jgi:hypothetical protein
MTPPASLSTWTSGGRPPARAGPSPEWPARGATRLPDGEDARLLVRRWRSWAGAHRRERAARDWPWLRRRPRARTWSRPLTVTTGGVTRGSCTWSRVQRRDHRDRAAGRRGGDPRRGAGGCACAGRYVAGVAVTPVGPADRRRGRRGPPFTGDRAARDLAVAHRGPRPEFCVLVVFCVAGNCPAGARGGRLMLANAGTAMASGSHRPPPGRYHDVPDRTMTADGLVTGREPQAGRSLGIFAARGGPPPWSRPTCPRWSCCGPAGPGRVVRIGPVPGPAPLASRIAALPGTSGGGPGWSGREALAPGRDVPDDTVMPSAPVGRVTGAGFSSAS